MQLTKHTDYAFRVLMYLANMPETKTTIPRLSERFDISKPHLMKVVNKLANEGWVKSIRGKNGGIQLGVHPEEISLRTVLERMENILTPVNCDEPVCFFRQDCQLKGMLFQAQEQYLTHLSKYTLADLVQHSTYERILTTTLES